MNNSKLFVGWIAWTTTEEGLAEAFSAYWTVVSAKIIIDRETGKSKWFWFVEMETEDEANAAIEAFNGKELDWRTLTVNIARPMEKKPFNDRD